MLGSRWMVVLAAWMAGCGGNVVVDGQTTGTSGGAGGSGANPLIGTWVGGGGAPTVLSERVTLGADGTATATDTFALIGAGTASCTGALDVTDTWTSTATTFSVSGGACSGSVSCPNGEDISCGPAETAAQTCTYTLSDDDDTLELTCPEGTGALTFTRQM